MHANRKFTPKRLKKWRVKARSTAWNGFKKADSEHLAAMEAMGKRMENPQAMQAWMQEKRKEFDALPTDGPNKKSYLVDALSWRPLIFEAISARFFKCSCSLSFSSWDMVLVMMYWT